MPTALAPTRPADYDELVDCPVEMGPFLERRFSPPRACRTAWWWRARRPSFDAQRLLRLTRKKSAKPPCASGTATGSRRSKIYLFLLNATHDGYGGLEHCNTTALDLQPR